MNNNEPHFSKKITTDFLTLLPAYGRDYKSSAEAKSDFLGGKDFVMTDPRHAGCYCSVRDFAPGTKVLLRYKRRTTVHQVVVPKTEEVVEEVK